MTNGNDTEGREFICPLKFAYDTTDSPACSKEKCAWWIGYGKTWSCAIIAIARSLGFISYHLKKQAGGE